MLLLVFVLAAAISLVTSSVLVARLERVGERLRAPEALLGLLAALAADAPEITAAAAAITAGRGAVGLGVTLGSNVFNLAALLGIGALVAGRIALHRRVIELEGALAVVVAGVATVVVLGWLAPAAGLVLTLVFFLPYVALASMGQDVRARLPIRRSWRRWLAVTMLEEEAELAAAIHPAPGTTIDALVAVGAAAVVVLASLVMESTATTLGAQAGVPDIIVGGLVLAAVTSLPNLVAAIHLASHGRGQATLSEAFNSNAINVLVGLLLPASLAGLADFTGLELLVVSAYLALTIATVAIAWAGRGLDRRSGAVIVMGYMLFVVVLATR